MGSHPNDQMAAQQSQMARPQSMFSQNTHTQPTQMQAPQMPQMPQMPARPPAMGAHTNPVQMQAPQQPTSPMLPPKNNLTRVTQVNQG